MLKYNVSLKGNNEIVEITPHFWIVYEEAKYE
jgi:hypothetical protein